MIRNGTLRQRILTFRSSAPAIQVHVSLPHRNKLYWASANLGRYLFLVVVHWCRETYVQLFTRLESVTGGGFCSGEKGPGD